MGLASLRADQRAVLIERLREQVAALALPGDVAVCLVGSWARGEQSGLSDIDLLVVAPEHRLERARDRLLDVADDVVAIETGSWQRRLAEGDPLIQGLAEDAVALTTPPPSPSAAPGGSGRSGG